MKKRIISSCIGIFLLMQMSAASATLLYDNGVSSWSGASNISNWVTADDFILNQDASLIGVSIDIWVSSSYDISNFGGMNWWVFDNNNDDDPGNIIYSGNSQNSVPTFIDVSSTGVVNFWKLFFELGEEVSLQKDNTYWLALRLSNLSDPISWSNSPVIGFNDAESFGGTFDNWEHASNPLVDKAFSLYGKPVPVLPTIVFFSTGLVWLFGAKTRKYS
jgi:hypothetical protein